MADGGTLDRDPVTNELILRPAAPAVKRAAEPMAHFGNLATTIADSSDLRRLSSSITEQVTYDQQARDVWSDMMADAVGLLGVGPESKPDDGEDGNTSDHPAMLTAMTRFQARALSALMPSPDLICRYEPAMDLEMIEDLKEREQMLKEVDDAGRRVTKYYSNYLLNEHPSYVEDTDALIAACGLTGVGLRKIYNDPSRPKLKTQIEFVPGQDLMLSYNATNWRCGRITHKMEVSTPDMIRAVQSGYYRPVERLMAGSSGTEDSLTRVQRTVAGMAQRHLQGGESHTLYETYLDLFLDADPHPLGLARPYVVTIHQATQEILSIQRLWAEADEEERRIERFVGYVFHPGVGSIGALGLGHLLSNVTRALRDIQRAGLDAAYLANHPSGFKLANLKIRDDATRVERGQFKDVESPVDDINKAIMPAPFKGADASLMALMERMQANAEQLGGTASMDFTQLMKSGVAAGPAMAAYEESTEFQSSIHRRLYDGQATEFRILHARMKEVVNHQAPLEFGEGSSLKPGDLLKVKIVPYMKPGQASKQRTILEAQAIKDAATEAPDIVNRRKAFEYFLRALGNPDLDALLIPDPDDNPPKPMDPVSEYNAVLAGKPVKAGPQQNHQAHITAHASQMKGLQLSQLPIEQGEAAAALLSAHIAEHMGLDMMVQVATRLGIPLEQFGEDMPPEMEAQIAPMVAQAIQEIEAERSAMAQGQDPDAGKMQLEQVKGSNAQRLEALKAANKQRELSLQHQFELEKQARDLASKEEIADHDDDTALAIAKLKGSGGGATAQAPARAAAGSGALADSKAQA